MSVKLSDIAHVAKVSTTTVSNVLRGRGRYSRATERAVVEAAERMGYFKNLGLTPDKTLGLMFCTPPVAGRDEPGAGDKLEFASFFTAEVVEAVERVVSEKGYQLLFQIVRETDSEADLPEMVKNRSIRGALIIGGSIRDDFIRAVHDRGIPMVLVFTHVDHSEINSVLVDYTDGAYQATKHLIDLGHKRIGLINGWRHTRTSDSKLEGYRRAIERAGLPFESSLVVESDFTFEGGEAVATAMLSRSDRPTAIFVADDLMALGAMRAAYNLGLAIPDDVAIVGFGDGPMAKVSNPALTSVRVPTRTLGEIAVERLFDVLEGDDRPYRIVIDVELVVRQSCGGARASAGM